VEKSIAEALTESSTKEVLRLLGGSLEKHLEELKRVRERLKTLNEMLLGNRDQEDRTPIQKEIGNLERLLANEEDRVLRIQRALSILEELEDGKKIEISCADPGCQGQVSLERLLDISAFCSVTCAKRNDFRSPGKIIVFQKK